MSGEELNRRSVEENAHDLAERAFDDRVAAALERVPDLSSEIPPDFAERMAALVPERKPVVVATTSYGKTAMWIGMLVLLVVVIVVSARGPAQSVMAMTVEGASFVQFVAIAVWLGVRRWRES